ncbi:hypothetical protein BY996DRAFT_4599939 [Phakopsora pachyrhizi]|nr:hypothetical protein BY996DRAFT_4599939 [Phakopsora pachyrhizi]
MATLNGDTHLAHNHATITDPVERYIQKALNFTLGQGTVCVVWIITFLGPISGLLYLASLCKRIRTEGAWLARVDSRGYLHPHTHVIIPCWIVLYTLGISFRVATIILHFCTYPILIATVWSLAYAMPPSEFSFKTRNGAISPRGKSRAHKPLRIFLIPFNISIVIFLASSFAYGIPLITIICYRITHLYSSLKSYESAALVSKDPNSSKEAVLKSQAVAISSLSLLYSFSSKLAIEIRLFCQLCLVSISCILIGIFYTSFRIFSALWSQLNIFKECIKRRKFDQIELIKSEPDFELEFVEKADNVKSVPLSPVEFSSKGSILRMGPFSGNLVMSWKSWLPVMAPNTRVKSRVWTSKLFNQTNRELDESEYETLCSHYRVLRRYAANTLWQTALTCVITVSYFSLAIFMIHETYMVSNQISLSNCFIVLNLWSSITWNSGVGITLGLVSFPLISRFFIFTNPNK